MPLNGKANPIAKPSWLKDAPAASSTSTTTTTPPAKPAWARKTSDVKKDEPVVKKEEPKKEVTTRLQSREIKVPFKVEKTIPTQSILKKPEAKAKQEVKEEPTPVKLRDSKTPPSKPPSKTPSKSPSMTPSKSPSTTPSKSPSKTPDFDSDDDESSYETDSSEEETDSDEESSDDEKPSYKPPSPGALRKHLIIPPLKRVSTTPSDPSEPERSTSPEHTFKKPELKKVITRQKSDAKERSPSPTEPKFFKPKLRKVPSSMRMKEPAPREKLPVVELKKAPPKAEDKSSRKMSEQFPHKPSILRAESSMKIPLPPPPPPPPPPPGLKPPSDFEKKPISQRHRETLEKLKSRPRRRPDWSEMMKEVEDSNRRLKHVQCNDRSSPIVTCKSLAKVQGQYVFETEKKNTALDQLLSQIQGGIRLKPVKTNDRSKPILDGLRKFRRQMTIEEQIMKSESKAIMADCPTSPILDDEEEDELDDIDKVRDDLQSTKQMLALELRNKEAQERENKRLMSKIANLEAELERERQRQGSGGNSESTPISNGADDAVVKSLKKEAEEAQKTSKMLEKKYQDTAERLDHAQKEVEEQKRLISNLEKKLQGGGVDSGSRRQSEAVQQKESSPELELVLSEEEEDETEEQKAERATRRLKREVDMLHAKLTKLKDKETNAKSERKSLRDAMKKNQQLLKAEKKTLKKLQKEVEKMAKMMQAVEDECNEDEDNEEKASVGEESESEEEESEPESEESESEDSDSDTESQSEAEDAEDDKKKLNLEPRVKRHDGRLASLKKGNYLLEANVERLKDEIKEHKEKCEALQADLDSVIDLC